LLTEGKPVSTTCNFTGRKSSSDGANGTLSLSVSCRIVPADNGTDGGKDARILAGVTEIGAAWKRQCNQCKTYTPYRSISTIRPPHLPCDDV
jgi:uncharacterized protein (DUF736 family)